MDKMKIVKIIIAIICLAGILLTIFLGLNYDLSYRENIQLDMDIGAKFSNKEMSDLVKEVLGNKRFIVSKNEVYQEQVSIFVPTDTTDEQLVSIVDKINEKYGTANTLILEDPNGGTVNMYNNIKIRGRDIVMPYIIPVAISLVLILVYAIILDAIYFKDKENKITGKLIVLIIASQLVYLGVLAIFRIPVSKFTMPISMGIYALVVAAVFIKTLRNVELPNNLKKLFE